jgi:hypothetical protein
MKVMAPSPQRKNFLPTLVLALVFWGSWGWLIYAFPPNNSELQIIFYFLLFGAVFLTTALIFASSKLGLFFASFIILALLFRYFQIGNLLNIFLLGGIFLALIFYFR